MVLNAFRDVHSFSEEISPLSPYLLCFAYHIVSCSAFELCFAANSLADE